MSRALLLVVTLTALARTPRPAAGDTIKIGYLTALKGTGEKHGLTISGAISLAVERINNRTDLLPGHTLEFVYADTEGTTRIGTKKLVDMICDKTVAFFGPENSCLIEANVAASFNLPMISYKCADEEVSNKKEFPNFARTYPPETQVTKSAVVLLKYYNWRKFSIITSEAPAISKIADSLEKLAKSQNMTINHKLVLPDYDRCCKERSECCDFQRLAKVIKDTREETRIYVFLGTAEALQNMLTTMSMFNMLNGSYMVIYIDLDLVVSKSNLFKYMWHADKMWELARYSDYECQPDDYNPLKSLLVVLATPPREQDIFSEQVRKYNARPPFNFPSPGWWTFKKYVGVYAAYLYDSVMMYALALNRTIADNPGLPLNDILNNGSEIVLRIRNQTFTSVMGAEIRMDDNGDSEGNFTVLALQDDCDHLSLRYESNNYTLSCRHCMQTIGKFYLGPGALPEFKIEKGRNIKWPNGEVPSDEPPCGFNGTKCFSSGDSRQIAASVLGSVLLLAIIVMLAVYRVWKEEQEIMGLLWKIDPADLAIGPPPLSDSKQSVASFESKGFGQIFTTTGRYRDTTVRVQTLTFSRKVDVSRIMMKEMRTMRELRNQNVNSFLGAVVNPNAINIVTDYCNRGSLPDILEGGDINLEYMFIAELIRDLVKGMLYLHNSALLVHGNLKSSNCVVTSRWVLKVTDFGLYDLRAASDLDSQSSYQYYKSQLWKSPEQLRSPESAPCGRPADVYAFGIILHEIMCRDGPFGGVHSPPGIEPKQIVGLVREVPSPGQEPYRPPLSSLHPPPDMSAGSEKLVVDCMKQCWQESEAARPNFHEIKKMLQPLREGLSANLVHQMMEKMEKYANNLEDLVRERTQLLHEEKQKTETLLYRMLPKSVASDLTRGDRVTPESFDSVTIYFSDIVGFTKISAESKPLEVVELLNGLYMLFDDIISEYDVYKVETIGDAYMVVSGVPKPNAGMHAGEIASMALSLLESIRQHKVEHRPDLQLKLRIGIHTGPVVAGVVGNTMPRYCLFGDTVNTASRVESTGEPLQIHISDECQRRLQQIGGYHTQRRGKVEMKGKGLLETHWLLDADPSRYRSLVYSSVSPPPVTVSPLPSVRSMGVKSGGSRQPSVRLEVSRPPSVTSVTSLRRRLALPPHCRRPVSLPAFGESRSLDTLPRAPRLALRPTPRRRNSRSVADCRELVTLEQSVAGGGGESAEPMLSPRLALVRRADSALTAEGEVSDTARLTPNPEDRDDQEEQERHDQDYQESERGDDHDPVVLAQLPSDPPPPAWDGVKDWFRRFFNRHRLEPGIPLNGKLKHNGYSLHSSRDTVV